MDPNEEAYYQRFVNYLEETQNEKYLGVLDQIAPDYDLKLLAQSVFMEYDPEEEIYIYDSAEPLSQELIDSGKMIATDWEGNTVTITSQIGNGNVYKGFMCHDEQYVRNVVIKWVDTLDHDINVEIRNWERFRDTGAQVPWFNGSFSIYGYPAFIIEELQPLQLGKENIPELTTQILNQLQKLHTFGCHADIKPDNILKKDKKYYLIDFGDIATNKLSYGYLRTAFTPFFTSQVNYYRTIITPKYDLLEFGFVLNYFTFESEGYSRTFLDMVNEGLKKLGHPPAQDWFRMFQPTDSRVIKYYSIIQNLSETEVISETYDLLSRLFIRNRAK